MTPILLRQLWTIVERMQVNLLLSLDDTSLVQCLAGQVTEQAPLDPGQSDALAHYIHSKLPLIRDMAQGRLVGEIG